MIRTLLMALSLTLALPMMTPAAETSSPQTHCAIPDKVTETARAWIDQGFGAGVVMATIDAKGQTCFFKHGVLKVGEVREVNEHTIFEIGSISKVFTALLLAQQVESGKLKLDTPVQDLLPTARIPKGSNRAITVQDLATQMSGLPRLPLNLNPSDPANPYADYTESQLWTFLASYSLPRPVGSEYEYSNLGFGLLGQALSQPAGRSYEALVQEHLLDPLQLKDTGINLARNQWQRFADGHAGRMPVPHWDLTSLAGAGALRSSATDMSRFMAAAMGALDTPLATAFALVSKPHVDTGKPALMMGLGWHILQIDGRQLVFHDGGTGGFASFAGFDPLSRQGVVVLANSSNFPSPALGLHLLNSALPLPQPRKEVKLTHAQMEALIGQYLIEAIGLKVIVTREGDKLMAGFVGQGNVELHPESATHFFLTEVDANLEFLLDAQGKANGLILTQSGQQFKGERKDP
ncbi:MAG: serine hydrolase [Candidatus Melainabacteria bacterium HGW-Melainabacteria-1]|nr:MAG: serine hydrolase [Candidatus Melainabacteria bacterium HGW-Melainabacteria-1]